MSDQMLVCMCARVSVQAGEREITSSEYPMAAAVDESGTPITKSPFSERERERRER